MRRSIGSRSRASRAAPGFTVVEILMAVAVLSFTMVPVLYLTSAQVTVAKVDRVRLLANALCLATLERFGRYENSPWDFLSPTENPRERVGMDLWRRDPLLGALVNDPGVRTLFTVHDVKSSIFMVRDLEPGLHQIVSDVDWRVDTGTNSRRERVTYSRFVAKEQIR